MNDSIKRREIDTFTCQDHETVEGLLEELRLPGRIGSPAEGPAIGEELFVVIVKDERAYPVYWSA